MRQAWLVACLVLGGGGIAVAQEDDSVGKVQKDFSALLQSNYEKLQKAGGAGNGQMLLANEADVLGFVDRCWKLHDERAGEDEEFDSLAQILSLTSTQYATETEKLDGQWRDAAQKLFKQFLDDDRMASFAFGLPAPKACRTEATSYSSDLKKNSKSKAVKAALEFATLQPQLQALEDDNATEEAQKTALTKLDAFVKDYGPLKMPRGGSTYAAYAEGQHFAIEKLKVGAVAPDIEGKDMDGVAFKLSDYKGKVVLLDFWGYW
jgi:hypothetical protein